MKLLLYPKNTDGATATMNQPETDAQKIARLEQENAALQGQINERKKQDEQAAADEEIILAKTRVGLSRPQAENVLRRQREHDKALASVWEKRRPAIVSILQRFRCTSGTVSKKCRMEIREIDASIVLDEIVAAQKSITGPEAKTSAATA